MSGMGELHLEITNYRIVNEHKVEIKTSQPIVVFRECVAGTGGPFEGKSPNKHNRFYIEVEALPPAVVQAIRSGEIETEGRIKDSKAMAKKLQDLGMTKDEGKGVVGFVGTNMLLDMTKGIQYLHETMELVKEAFEEAMNRGPLCEREVHGDEGHARGCEAARGLASTGVRRRSSQRPGARSTARCARLAGYSTSRSRSCSSTSPRT